MLSLNILELTSSFFQNTLFNVSALDLPSCLNSYNNLKLLLNDQHTKLHYTVGFKDFIPLRFPPHLLQIVNKSVVLHPQEQLCVSHANIFKKEKEKRVLLLR